MKTLDSFAPPPVPGLVDDEEMADITRLSVAAINKLRQDGLIPYLRIGNRVRFDPAAVLAAIARAVHSPRTTERRESARMIPEEGTPGLGGDGGEERNPSLQPIATPQDEVKPFCLRPYRFEELQPKTPSRSSQSTRCVRLLEAYRRAAFAYGQVLHFCHLLALRATSYQPAA